MIGDSGTSKTGKIHRYYTCNHRKRHRTCDKKMEKLIFSASSVFFVSVLFQYSLFDDLEPHILLYDGALITLYAISIATLMIAKDKNLTFSQKFLHQSY